MKRTLALALLLFAAFFSLLGCSHYTDDFANEEMIIYQLDVVNVTENTATIQWQTSKKGTSEVFYKRESSLENFVQDTSEKLSHSVTLTNLFPQREYICRVISKNEDGYEDQWEDIIFNTKPSPPVLPPETPIN